MRMMVSIPMNHYLRCDVIYTTSKADIYDEYVKMSKVLSADIVNIEEPRIQTALIKIIDEMRDSFPMPTTYRLWDNRNFYVEETIIE